MAASSAANAARGSPPCAPPAGRPNAPAARFCGECGTPLAGARPPGAARRRRPRSSRRPSASPAPVAERRARLGPVRGPRRLHDAVRGARPRGGARAPVALLRARVGRHRPLRRHRREVHRRRGHGGLGRAGGPRGRRRARGPRRRSSSWTPSARSDPGLQARAGVLTGEAAVTIGARDQGMVAGDLVNTGVAAPVGSRPPGTVLVGEATHRATLERDRVRGGRRAAAQGQGRAGPGWRALRVVAERGGRGRDDRLEAPFVGRDAELRLLKDLFHATSRERRVAARLDHRARRASARAASRGSSSSTSTASSRASVARGPLARPTARASRSGRWAR